MGWEAIKKERLLLLVWEGIKEGLTEGLIEILEIWARLEVYVTREVKSFFKWFLFSVAVGITVGAVGAAFHHAVEIATELRREFPWLIFLLPVAGLLIYGMYHLMKMDNDGGTEFVLASVRDARYLRPVMVPLIFLSTTLTHLCGGSAGREGAALQIGGGIASFLGRVIHLDDMDERIITMAGMAAGFSALFGTPLAAAVFAMEVASVGTMYYSAIVPCFFSSLLADIVASHLGCSGTSFVVFNAPDLNVVTMLRIIALGAFCGMMANIFCRVMRCFGWTYRHAIKKQWLKAIVGGVLIILMTQVFGTDYNGAGMNIIADALGGRAETWAFLLKILFTAITLNAGFKGGEIVPSFYIGATFGCVIAPLLGLDPSFGASVGMVSVFCGVTNSPMTSILLGYELFAGVGVAPLALAVAVSYMLSGYTGLYHEQKVVHSKTKTVVIDKMGTEEYFNRENDLNPEDGVEKF